MLKSHHRVGGEHLFVGEEHGADGRVVESSATFSRQSPEESVHRDVEVARRERISPFVSSRDLENHTRKVSILPFVIVL